MGPVLMRAPGPPSDDAAMEVLRPSLERESSLSDELEVPRLPDRRLPSLLGLPASGWRRFFRARGWEAYRGDQVARWVFWHDTFVFDAMSDLPISMRKELAVSVSVAPPPLEADFKSIDESRRSLLRLADGGLVETVCMPYPDRLTLCISSQVGCRFACSFCQTGLLGLTRSLSAEEIVGQVVRMRSEATTEHRRINVVFMGQGEPLDNFAAVAKAIAALQDERGPALSWRRITVSTVGVVPGLLQLAEQGQKRPRIAVSLNATTDEARAAIMPINRKYGIAALMAALRQIRWRPRETVTIEYVLLAGINDTLDDACRLGDLLRGLPAKINLIPWNPIPTLEYRRPAPENVERFRRAVVSAGPRALVRYSRGADIGAACGQLAALKRPTARAPLG